MTIHEETTIAVSETQTVIADNDTIVVKEAFGQLPESSEHLPIQPPSPEKQPIMRKPPSAVPTEDVESKHRTDLAVSPKNWLESQDAKDFEPFLVGEMKRIKPPSACIGRKNEIERSLGQAEKLNSYISKALRSDWSGDIPIESIDRLREQLEQNIDALNRMLEAHKEMKKQRRQVRRRASDDSACQACSAPLWEENGKFICLSCEQKELKKEAGTPFFQGISTQISAFENAVTSMLINAVVSGGRDMEELYKKLKKKYDFSPREELAILQILSDKGYPIFKDRARLDENEDPTDPKEPREWQSQYYA